MKQIKNASSSKTDSIMMYFAVIALLMSVVASGVTYFSVSHLISQVTGEVTGFANLTVESAAVINFSTQNISWGSGRVNSGQTKAFLDTLSGTVTNGNWTSVTIPLWLTNIGNTNVSLNLSVGKTPASFLGGTAPAYTWNVSNNESGSCLNGTTYGWGTYATPPTNGTTNYCLAFQFLIASNEIKIHFNLTVPNNGLTGSLGDIITATADA